MNFDKNILSNFISPFLSSGVTGDTDVSNNNVDSLSSADASDPVESFLANFWTPEKLAKKRKRRSGPGYSPEDRCNSMFYKTEIL